MGWAVRAELGEEPGLVLGEAICFPEAAGRPSPSGPGPTLGAVREPRCIQGPMGTLGPPPQLRGHCALESLWNSQSSVRAACFKAHLAQLSLSLSLNCGHLKVGA